MGPLDARVISLPIKPRSRNYRHYIFVYRVALIIRLHLESQPTLHEAAFYKVASNHRASEVCCLRWVIKEAPLTSRPKRHKLPRGALKPLLMNLWAVIRIVEFRVSIISFNHLTQLNRHSVSHQISIECQRYPGHHEGRNRKVFSYTRSPDRIAGR